MLFAKNDSPNRFLNAQTLSGSNPAYTEHKIKREHTKGVLSFNGTPEGIRTPDLLVRSQTLYPAELPAHNSFYCPNKIPLQTEKVNSFFMI